MDENRAHIVASQYELVKRIVGSLPDASLDACEKVNTLWSNAVKVERNSQRRKSIKMFSWKGKAQSIRVSVQNDSYRAGLGLKDALISVLCFIWHARV